MSYSKYDFKVAFLDSIFSEFEGREINVLDMGSGTSKDFVEVLKNFPNINYTALEFNPALQNKARQLLQGCGNVDFINGFGEEIQGRYNNHFDVTLSLSVLEHVKNIKEFLLSSIKVTKPGGSIIHRYDLGHSLHSSLYEKTKVFICNHIPFCIPKRYFTFHPGKSVIVSLLQSENVEIAKIFYSQMPDLKGMMNKIQWERPDAIKTGKMIIELDAHLSNFMQGILPEHEMEYYFPAVTIIGTKKPAVS